MPADAIAGDPPEYVEALLRFTIRNVALVAPTQQMLDHWPRSDLTDVIRETRVPPPATACVVDQLR